MAIFLQDGFDFTAGTSLNGRTADIGGVWQNYDALADCINYGGNRVGERNSLPNSSSIFRNSVTTPQADYNVTITFIAGTSVFGQNSLGIILRLQQAAPAVLLDYYALYYRYQGDFELQKRADNIGGAFTLDTPYTIVPGNQYTLDFGVSGGTTLTASINGVNLFTRADAFSPITPKGSVGILVNNCVVAFSDTAGWWFGDYTAYDSTPGDANFGLYFAGSGSASGEDFAPVQYSTPTPVIIGNPVAGTEYAISVKPTDLAGFVNSRMGNVKLRRNGADTQGTTPAVLRGISIQYKKIET